MYSRIARDLMPVHDAHGDVVEPAETEPVVISVMDTRVLWNGKRIKTCRTREEAIGYALAMMENRIR